MDLIQVVKSLFNSFDPDIKISAVEGKTFTPEPRITQCHAGLAGSHCHVGGAGGKCIVACMGTNNILQPSKGVDDAFMDVSGLDSMIYDGTMKLKDRNRPYAVVGQGVAYSLRIGLSFVDPLFVYTIDRTAQDQYVPARRIHSKGFHLSIRYFCH